MINPEKMNAHQVEKYNVPAKLKRIVFVVNVVAPMPAIHHRKRNAEAC